jgi:hypothetical protein
MIRGPRTSSSPSSPGPSVCPVTGSTIWHSVFGRMMPTESSGASSSSGGVAVFAVGRPVGDREVRGPAFLAVPA